MAGFTLTATQVFPPGTSVGAYQAFSAEAPAGGPTTAVVNTQTMGTSNLTFTGLEDGVRYWAYAQVGGAHRYIGFIPGTDVAEEDSLEGLSLTLGSGDDVTVYASGVTGQVGNVRLGTSGAPTEDVGPALKVSRTGAVTRAAIEALGGAGTDGSDQLAAVMGVSSGTADEEVQGIGVAGFAKSASTVGFPGNDACGVYGAGRALSTSDGVLGLGVFASGRRDTDDSRANGLEVAVGNYSGVADSYNSSGFTDTTGIWITAPGDAQAGAAIVIGKPTGRQQFDVGFGVPSGYDSIKTATFRDDGSALRSIDIRGAHTSGAIQVAETAGDVAFGASASSAAKLYVKASDDAQFPLLLRAHSATQSVALFEVQDSSLALMFRVGPSGNVTLKDGGSIAVGTSTGTKIGIAANAKIGFWNSTPVVQPTAVADAAGGATIDAEARTALNALLAKLRTIGLIAT